MDPCVDFFQYACGTWNKVHVIPEDKSSISTFEVMSDQLQIILKGDSTLELCQLDQNKHFHFRSVRRTNEFI